MSDLIRKSENSFSHDAAHFNLEMKRGENSDSRRVAIAIKRSKRLPPIFSCLNRVDVSLYHVFHQYFQK